MNCQWVLKVLVKRGCGYKTKLIKEAWGYEFKTHQVLVTCMNCQWVLKILVKRGCGNNTHYSSGTCIYYTNHLCTRKIILIAPHPQKWASHRLTLSPGSIIMDSTYLALFPKLNNSSIFFFLFLFSKIIYICQVFVSRT